jgi:hypothetical protein
MTSFYSKISNKIISSDSYLDAYDLIFDAYIKKTAGDKYSIDRSVVKKLTTSLQYFYQSDDELVRKEGAELLSMLLYVSAEETQELVAIAGYVFNESGDFPNITLLQDKFPSIKFKVSAFDEARRNLRKSLNTVKEIDHPLTDYQRSLWEDLKNGEDIITAAPTSTGKTYVILQYLVNEVATSAGAFAAIIVPTRSLISEISSKIYDIAKNESAENDIEICTIPKEGVFKDKTIFVMTQERIFDIIQTGILSFDYLFVDEAHNISDKSRGVLLHMTLQRLLEGSNPQIIISMPSKRYLNAFSSIFGDTEFSNKTTKQSPVAKILIDTKLKRGNILLSRKNGGKEVVLKKNFSGKKLAQIAYRLGAGESNIVYCNKTNYCEDVALDIAGLVSKDKDSPRLTEAADYVTRFLHPEFSLAGNLKKGVAFHYGPLPGVVRRMIEGLVRDNEVDFIVCTSTLAEGVNLPAKNLFLKNPMQIIAYKPSERMEDVRLDNITGRAGRMLEHFAGNIFLVDQENWTYKDYFEDKEDKIDKIPTYYQILNSNLDGVIQALHGEYSYEEEDQYTFYSIANKLLREFDSDTIGATLSAKELVLSERDRAALLKEVNRAFDRLQVDSFTLEANPTVGYLQQNSLYSFLLEQDDLSRWALPHPMSQGLYLQLKQICTELNRTGIFLPKKSSVSFACVIARKWIQGDPLRTIIAEQIAHHPEISCNKNVRDVITTINNDIRFKMASALRCYQLLFTNAAQERGEDVVSVKLHAFIEAGGCDERLIQLINLGLSRETAIEIDSLLEKSAVISSFESLHSLFEEGVLEELHPVTKKELDRLLL